jgi:hypothetical protein
MENRMKIKRIIPIFTLFTIWMLHGSALAQTYLFSMDAETVNVYWNEDGTSSIDYLFTFTNNPSASPIDYVDVGIPNSNFEIGSISADVDGTPITDISSSGYEGSGSGVAVGLGSAAIPPGKTGRVHVFIGVVRRVVYPDSQDSNYASADFSPTYFGSSYVTGTTDLRVTFHLPPGVTPDEPRWHQSPASFPSEPETSLDADGRVSYSWANPNANGYTQYIFGASFPKQYIPDSAIVRKSFLESLGLSSENISTLTICCGFFALIIAFSSLANRSAGRRKLQYLPPKVAIEGHGIKRGLTSIEAAILLEQPLDKILTMVLFATIKKGAATVEKRDPLEIEVTSPLPEGLQPYEKDFLDAFQIRIVADRKKKLQEMMIGLVKAVSQKMKGFSRRETIAYYRDIVQRAWAQVEAASTPEVKSKMYDDVMEWTMLDKDYDDRTREVFRGGPVFVPVWWGRYDPGYGRSIGPSTAPVSVSGPVGPSGGGLALPHLPGSDFAASVVNSVQNFSSSVIGNINDFTSGVTNKTNPVPVTTSSGRSYHSGGGGGCACACACAGCACACAGGGR